MLISIFVIDMKWSTLLYLVATTRLVLGRPGIEQQIIMLESSNSSILQYPSQFTQGIMPKAIHSHNDYWRDVPLLTALSLGVASMEADVWYLNGTLFVGHETAALSPDRTFDSLYIRPLIQILAAQNPHNRFTINQTKPRGVFDTASDLPLQLLVDMKTDGNEMFSAVLEALEPLRRRGYLTTVTNGSLSLSVVTVIGTGNTPLSAVQALSPRDFFFDAPLTDIASGSSWDPLVSPLASTDYAVTVGWNGLGNISDSQLLSLTTLINAAHDKGIKARFWDTPAWPIHARSNIWRILLDNGADWLNADDLQAASEF